MKYNIRRVNYYGEMQKDGQWWAWEETCDKCGADCEHSKIYSSKQPDTKEADFCVNCIVN